jgi:tetrahydromethanopterin S-methyltransferase subunit F
MQMISWWMGFISGLVFALLILMAILYAVYEQMFGGGDDDE